MPIRTAEEIYKIALRMLQAAGVSEYESNIVAEHLSECNLVGHDSHGLMRLPQYVQFVKDGYLKIDQQCEVIVDKPSITVVEGNYRFGQVVATECMTMGIQKAKENGIATVMGRNCMHCGRLGAFSHRAAREGLACIMAVNSPGPGQVSPFGGSERRLGTNPISAAVPCRDEAILLDMTTSATAEGKLRVAFQKGESVPEGLMLNGYGKPSTDPGEYYAEPNGSILPLGGIMAHKGYGLSVMVDMFAGVLSGAGIARTDLPRGVNGLWIHLMDVEQFMPRAQYDEWIEKYIKHIKSARLQDGVEEILLPGEIEARRKTERQETGISVPEGTWKLVSDLADEMNVNLNEMLA